MTAARARAARTSSPATPKAVPHTGAVPSRPAPEGQAPAFQPRPGPPLAALDFDDDAYRRYRLPARKLRDTERRLEFWDGDTETALEVREPTTPYHERPSHLLAQLVGYIAQVRGKPIACFGTMDLEFPATAKCAKRILQADQSMYLHPDRANLVGPAAMVVGENHYPDVVLEVDYSTDVRRNKLELYDAWGFPEVWVDVPEQSVRRRRSRGITIYVRKDDALSPAPASRAFPSWRATEIHAALNEERLTERTAQALERVGRLLGERDGTGPDDHLLARSLRRQAKAEARAAELERRAAFVCRLLASRGVAVSGNFPLDQPGFADADIDALADMALDCASQAEFAAQLARARKS